VASRQSGELVFRPGPIFANVVLADELNRATPRTQSGLLEAMAERSVSIDGTTHTLPEPFMVVATQNPAEHHGVYPLPESQLDRFLIRTSIGYPEGDVERALLSSDREKVGVEQLSAVDPPLPAEVIQQLMAAVDKITLSDPVAAYLHAIVRATRESKDLETGVSTRGAILYARAARARALVLGRGYVTPDDVHALAVAVCAHRVTVRGVRRANRVEAEAILEALLHGIPIPV
jgi:MoxR-like ATPase